MGRADPVLNWGEITPPISRAYLTPVTHSFSAIYRGPINPFIAGSDQQGLPGSCPFLKRFAMIGFFFPPLYCDVLKQGRHEHIANPVVLITDGSIFHPGKIITYNNPSITKNETPQSKTCCRAFSIMNPTKNEPSIPIILMLNILMLKSFNHHVNIHGKPLHPQSLT